MSLRVAVRVTRDDIAKGGPKDANPCPIARATKRRFRKRTVAVLQQFVLIGTDKYWLDSKACDFIENFDHGRPVKPGFIYMVKEG